MHLSVHFAGIAVGRLLAASLLTALDTCKAFCFFPSYQRLLLPSAVLGLPLYPSYLPSPALDTPLYFLLPPPSFLKSPLLIPEQNWACSMEPGDLVELVGPWIAGLLMICLAESGMAVNLCFCLVLFVCIAAYLKSQSLRSFAESSR